MRSNIDSDLSDSNHIQDDLAARALRRLPHGPEFRFIDRLVSLEPGRRGTAEYDVRDEPFLRGHFPGDPLFPGVLLVEAAAQLAGVIGQSDPTIPPMKDLRLTAIRNVKILGTASPGETICIEAEINGRLAHLINAKATISTATSRLLMQAELSLSGIP